MPSSKKVAVLYRMKTPEHTCPFGLRSLALLRRKGFAVDDRLLTSREQIDAFKDEHGVRTTPQTFIDGGRIGGHEDLRRFFSLPVRDKSKKTYVPVIAIFASAAMMAAAMTWAVFGTLVTLRTAEWFIAISMCLLAVQKLRDLDAFTNTFLGYDLLARRQIRYAYVYPFAELLAGVLMIAGALLWFAAPLALFIGAIGAVSVYRAVYIEKRDLRCACVGGNSNVPLGFVSLLENVMMVAMATWMLLK